MSSIFILMGVSGCGKSTIGQLLADKSGLPFFDADDYHPEENKIKMAHGRALQDADRLPWLKHLSVLVNEWSQNKGAILACSALKESYRKILSQQMTVKWVYLHGSFELIKQRLSSRKNHFMNQSLLQSQFETLEVPTNCFQVDIRKTEQQIVDSIISKYRLASLDD